MVTIMFLTISFFAIIFLSFAIILKIENDKLRKNNAKLNEEIINKNNIINNLTVEFQKIHMIMNALGIFPVNGAPIKKKKKKVVEKPLNIDDILEEISKNGMESLTPEKLEFLKNNKKDNNV